MSELVRRSSSRRTAATTPPRTPSEIRVQASPARCPFCHTDVLTSGEDWVACAACLARHHTGCWSESGRCATCSHKLSLAAGAVVSPSRGFADPVRGLALLLLGPLLGLVVALALEHETVRAFEAGELPLETLLLRLKLDVIPLALGGGIGFVGVIMILRALFGTLARLGRPRD